MTGEPVKTDIEVLLRVMETNQAQLQFADTKAGLIALFHTVSFGFIASQADRLVSASRVASGFLVILGFVLLCGYAGSTLWAMVLVIRAVMPRFERSKIPSRIFFGDVARVYGNDAERYTQELERMDDAEWVRELATHNLAVCRIAQRKHTLIRAAAKCTALAMILAVSALGCTLLQGTLGGMRLH
jgi:hypothetical protein